MFKFNLGLQVRDTVTGFVGVITVRAEYKNNQQNRYLLETTDTTGRPIEWWYDEDRLELYYGE